MEKNSRRTTSKRFIKKHKKGIIITLIFYTIVLLFLAYYIGTSEKFEPLSYAVKDKSYKTISDYYQGYDEIQQIINKCKNAEPKSYCVFTEIPFSYDNNRANGLPYNPKVYMLMDGHSVCRDVAVMRKATLDGLGVENLYMFEPDHVYVEAYENNVKYIMDNQFLTETIII